MLYEDEEKSLKNIGFYEKKEFSNNQDTSNEKIKFNKQNDLSTKDTNKNSNETSNQDNNCIHFKWIVLFFSCLSCMGNYYCFDNPGALRVLLKKHFSQGEIKDESFEYFYSLMYSVYSLPNIVLPIIGGFLIFRFGNRIVYVCCALFIMIGQFIFVIGITKKDVFWTLFGRVIFGLGGETINTTQSTILIAWFPLNQVTFAFGISLSFFRLCSSLNDYLSPKIATNTDLTTALWIGFTMCCFSFIVTLFLMYIEWRENLINKMTEITNSYENNENENNDKEKDNISLNKKEKKETSLLDEDEPNYDFDQVLNLNKVKN
jgi:nitrate/nitrite transporter NarK